MKLVSGFLLLVIFLFNQMSVAAPECRNLFSEDENTNTPSLTLAMAVADEAADGFKQKSVVPQAPTTLFEKFNTEISTLSPRARLFKINDEGFRSRLKIEALKLSENVDEAVLEVMRLLVDGTTYALEDKNVLLKNKMSLGIKLNDGYTFLVNYESKSSSRPWFVVDDKIILVSPTNKEVKLTDNLIDPVTLKIAKADFDMPEYFEKDSQIVLKIPLSIEPEVLEKLADYSTLFEHMPKQKLRQLLSIESPIRRNALLKLERIKSMFKKEAMKQPFKIVLGGTFMGLISFGLNHALINNNQTDVLKMLNEKPPAVVALATTTAAFSPQEALAQAQYEALLTEARLKAIASPLEMNKLRAKDFLTAGGKSFTINANTFIFEQIDSMNGSLHTYLVIAEEKSVHKKAALQYFAMEINAIKYEPLIRAIKNHQQLK